MDQILALKKRLETAYADSKRQNPFLVSAQIQREMKAVVQAYVKNLLLWADSGRCLQCVKNRSLMATWVAEDVAGWTVPGGHAYFQNYFDPGKPSQTVGISKTLPVAPVTGLLTPPAVIAAGPLDWFPSAMYLKGDIFGNTSPVAAPINQGVGPILVGIRRSPLLQMVLANRAWRSLPTSSDRRFWGRLFGDHCGCVMNCWNKVYGLAYEDFGTTFKYGDALGPTIPYFFGLPPVWPTNEYPKYLGCKENVVNESVYGESNNIAVLGRPKPALSTTYAKLNLYVIAVPVIYGVTGVPVASNDPACEKDAPPSLQNSPCTCWLVRPASLVSPFGQKEIMFETLANAELMKWTLCKQGDVCTWPLPLFK